MRLNYRTRRTPRGLAIAALTAACVVAPPLAQAVPITIAATNVWRADRTANPIGFPTTALVPWIEVNTSSGDVNATAVTASVAGQTFNLQRIPTGALAGLYFTQIPYDVALTGPWTITATNGTDTQQTTRPGFVPVDPMPFVEEIGFTGTGSAITVNWTVSDAVVPQLIAQQVAIWNLSGPSPVTEQFFSIPVASRSLDLASLALDPGTLYAVEINNLSRNAQTGFIDAFSGNWVSGWTPTVDGEVQLPTSVPEPTTLTLLLAGLAGAGLLRRRAATTG
jgi:hypothetical protein